VELTDGIVEFRILIYIFFRFDTTILECDRQTDRELTQCIRQSSAPNRIAISKQKSYFEFYGPSNIGRRSHAAAYLKGIALRGFYYGVRTEILWVIQFLRYCTNVSLFGITYLVFLKVNDVMVCVTRKFFEVVIVNNTTRINLINQSVVKTW